MSIIIYVSSQHDTGEALGIAQRLIEEEMVTILEGYSLDIIRTKDIKNLDGYTL